MPSEEETETIQAGALAHAFEEAAAGDDVQAQRVASVVEQRLFSRATIPVTLVGRFMVLRRIGQGGGGVVFEAYDPELDRKVALKLLRGDRRRGRKDLELRLLQEARTLARLTHPNVVTVFDVGIHDGGGDGKAALSAGGKQAIPPRGVFLVMELVEGSDLQQWLAQGSRSWREIFARFVGAGRGLAAAHAIGLVHRDFKPSNVLLRGDGRVLVADFGLARGLDDAFSSQGSERPVLPEHLEPSVSPSLTQSGVVLGTPTYMAPEQHRGEIADARSDQYAFCLALHEALFGKSPFADAKVEDLLAAKMEGPPRQPASGRPCPAWLRAAIRKGLEPDPAQRHASMQELLHRLERGAGGRRRLGNAMGVALVAGGFAWALLRSPSVESCTEGTERASRTWNADIRARVHDRFMDSGLAFAEDASTRVDLLLTSYLDAWASAENEACAPSAAPREEHQRACLDNRLVAVQALVSVLTEASPTTIENATLALDSLEPVATCEDREASVQAPSNAAPEELARARASYSQARALFATGDFQQAEARATAALAQAQALNNTPLEARILALLAETRIQLLVDPQQIRKTIDDALAAAERGQDDAAVTDVLGVLVAMEGVWEGNFDQAMHFAAHAGARMARYPTTALRRARLALLVGGAQFKHGDYDAAARSFEEALADPGDEGAYPSGHVASVHNALAGLWKQAGDLEQAREHLQIAMSIRVESLGERHPFVASTLSNLGLLQVRAGALADARASFLGAIDILGAEDPRATEALGGLASIDAQSQRYTRALERYRRVLAIRIKAFGDDHLQVAEAQLNVASMLFELHRQDEGRPLLESALRTFEDKLVDQHAWLLVGRTLEGAFLHRDGRPGDAAARLERVLATLRSLPDADPTLRLEVLAWLGQAYVALGDPRGEDALESALALAAEHARVGQEPTLARIHFALARALHPSQLRRALELAGEAADGYAQWPEHASDQREVLRWLREAKP